MKRFYRDSIDALKKLERREIADNIEEYVNYLELVNHVLVYELSITDSFSGQSFLKKLGFKGKVE